MTRPKLLDLFCCAGGAAMGYHLAGFDVIGVDIKPQKHYPFEFIQADALTFPLEGYDVIHASPPCQDYSSMANISRHKKKAPDYPRLLSPMRDRLRKSGALYIMENVAGAALTAKAMDNPIMLCGTSLGLRTRRHRYFETNMLLFSAGTCRHQAGDISVGCSHAEYCSIFTDVLYTNREGEKRRRNKRCPKAEALVAMGIEWPMTNAELGEAVPPRMTEWLGWQLMRILDDVREGRSA